MENKIEELEAHREALHYAKQEIRRLEKLIDGDPIAHYARATWTEEFTRGYLYGRAARKIKRSK
jgi:hypothetical protein